MSWYWESEKARFQIMNLSRSEIEHLIDEWVLGMHAERNRAITKRHVIDGICFEPLAEEFDISVRQAKNIVKKSMIAVCKHIK